jgi:two-component system response regulator AtoC
VGGNETIKPDIRIIAATNRNLEEMISAGTFRQDLYYRLNVVCLQALPLRERTEDIMLLADYFLQKFAIENGKDMGGFDAEAIGLLEKYNWPGNVRELQNVIERAVIMSIGNVVVAEDLPDTLLHESVPAKQRLPEVSGPNEGKLLKEMVKRAECQFIEGALVANNGNKMKTAKELGISLRSLQYKIQEYAIE